MKLSDRTKPALPLFALFLLLINTINISHAFSANAIHHQQQGEGHQESHHEASNAVNKAVQHLRQTLDETEARTDRELNAAVDSSPMDAHYDALTRAYAANPSVIENRAEFAQAVEKEIEKETKLKIPKDPKPTDNEPQPQKQAKNVLMKSQSHPTLQHQELLNRGPYQPQAEQYAPIQQQKQQPAELAEAAAAANNRRYNNELMMQQQQQAVSSYDDNDNDYQQRSGVDGMQQRFNSPQIQPIQPLHFEDAMDRNMEKHAEHLELKSGSGGIGGGRAIGRQVEFQSGGRGEAGGEADDQGLSMTQFQQLLEAEGRAEEEEGGTSLESHQQQQVVKHYGFFKSAAAAGGGRRFKAAPLDVGTVSGSSSSDENGGGEQQFHSGLHTVPIVVSSLSGVAVFTMITAFVIIQYRKSNGGAGSGANGMVPPDLDGDYLGDDDNFEEDPHHQHKHQLSSRRRERVKMDQTLSYKPTQLARFFHGDDSTVFPANTITAALLSPRFTIRTGDSHAEEEAKTQVTTMDTHQQAQRQFPSTTAITDPTAAPNTYHHQAAAEGQLKENGTIDSQLSSSLSEELHGPSGPMHTNSYNEATQITQTETTLAHVF